MQQKDKGPREVILRKKEGLSFLKDCYSPSEVPMNGLPALGNVCLTKEGTELVYNTSKEVFVLNIAKNSIEKSQSNFNQVLNI